MDDHGYTLTLASFILLGGSLGDRFGRRRVFVIGTVWFAVASALCALAPTIEILIAARALQGVGGALLTPGSLAIIPASFDTDDRREGHRRLVRPRRRRECNRAIPRRVSRRRPRLALGLPRQPAAGADRRRHRAAPCSRIAAIRTRRNTLDLIGAALGAVGLAA